MKDAAQLSVKPYPCSTGQFSATRMNSSVFSDRGAPPLQMILRVTPKTWFDCCTEGACAVRDMCTACVQSLLPVAACK